MDFKVGDVLLGIDDEYMYTGVGSIVQIEHIDWNDNSTLYVRTIKCSREPPTSTTRFYVRYDAFVRANSLIQAIYGGIDES